ncbi:MAG: SDR family NAD(P)-dependent oxidoreductase [Armatimonadetes bacterium]|nr:SDR family NAD(P)-dependent oxidoreductase [Armatimonadota bacterium]
MAPNWKRAIIVGASGGIGEQIARKLASGGCRVALVGRREDKLRQIAVDINGVSLNLALPFPSDVRDFDAPAAKVEECVRALGGLDLVVYSAGVMPRIGPTEYETAKDRLIVETNLIGAMAWLNPVAKRFERAGGGTIVGIGSVSGDRGRRGNPAYSASKAGLECYLESLRNRLGRRGVSVVTVKPGPVETEMTRELGRLPGMIPAGRAADLILKAARKFGKTAYIPGRWWLASKIMLSIPSRIFRRLPL